MEVFEILIDYFNLEYTAINFAEFVPWFFQVLLAVALVVMVIKAFFWCIANIMTLLR